MKAMIGDFVGKLIEDVADKLIEERVANFMRENGG
jgi:hypothetical protein